MDRRREPTIGRTDVADLYRRPTGHTVRERINAPRTPWLASLLGFFVTPVGFAYVGRPLAGVLLLALPIGAMAALGFSGVVHSVAGIWSVLALALVAQLVALVMPWLLARKAQRRYVPQWYNQWYVYVLLVVLISVPAVVLLLNKERYFGFGTYRAPSASMAPTIERGDLFVVDTRAATVAAVKPNDIVVFRSWHDPSVMFVKRIVAMPGQAVRIDQRGLQVDGKPEQRVSATGADMLPREMMLYTNLTLDADEFYVVGDNRDNSDDSRSEGPLRRADLIGRATTLYFSGSGRKLGPIH